jgi:molybdate transport system substrate-binding protein
VSGAEILVFAAASLTDALTEIGAAFERVHPGTKVRFSFGASSDLARQIQAGAPADLFVSADRAKMDGLQKVGLVDSLSRVDLLTNELVVIVPKESRLHLDRAADLGSEAVNRIALADPEAVPAGMYARAWLRNEGVWEKVAPKILPTLDVRAALAAVDAGSADCGVVYRTDATISKKSRVAFEVPAELAPAIVYPAALVLARTTGNGVTRGGSREIQDPAARPMTETHAARRGIADAFLGYLRRQEAREIFRRAGFGVLPDAGGR